MADEATKLGKTPYFVNKRIKYKGAASGPVYIDPHPADDKGKEYTLTFEHLPDPEIKLLEKMGVIVPAKVGDAHPYPMA